MIILNLLCRKDIQGYYDTSLFINNVPFVYYIALLGGACDQYIVLSVGMVYILDIRKKSYFIINMIM